MDAPLAIQTLDGHIMWIRIYLDFSVKYLINHIKYITSNPQEFILFFRGRQLRPAFTLDEYNIKDNQVIVLVYLKPPLSLESPLPLPSSPPDLPTLSVPSKHVNLSSDNKITKETVSNTSITILIYLYQYHKHVTLVVDCNTRIETLKEIIYRKIGICVYNCAVYYHNIQLHGCDTLQHYYIKDGDELCLA